MPKEFLNCTPREVLQCLGVLVPKPIPDPDILKNAIQNLPVASSNINTPESKQLKLVGTGDWKRKRTTNGRVILAGQDYVLKFPLGEQHTKTDPFEIAQSMKNMAKSYEGFSPKTSFFIAQPDGPNTEPKVVTYQKKIDGKTVCDTPIKDLIKPEVVNRFDTLVKHQIRQVEAKSVTSNSGLHIEVKGILGKKILSILDKVPWLSDNAMIDKNNNLNFIDNTPHPNENFENNPIDRAKYIKKMKYVWTAVKFTVKVYNFVTNGKHKPATAAENSVS